MPRLSSRSPSEVTVLTAWQDQLATAAPTPWLAQERVQQGDILLPQFATWYAQLRVLPRCLRRALQRKLALPLAGVALLLALGQAPAQAATIAVDGTTCTLVDAITAANTDTAQGGCPAGSGADTLVLEPPGRTVTLTHVNNTTYGPTGLPVIRSVITIAGQGGTITRASSAPAFRLLAVNGSGDLTLQDITVTGGAASGGFPAGSGGGVFNRNGTVTLEDSRITGNTAEFGGGMSNRGDGTTLTLVRSTITGNTATGSGGGLENTGDDYARGGVTVRLTQSTISGNTATGGAGGGMLNFGDYGGVSVTLTQSTISGNTAGRGGGVYTYFHSPVTLTESTITGNTATGSGGGVFSSYSNSVRLIRSLVAGNVAPTAPEVLQTDGTVTANAFNLFGVHGDSGVTGFAPGPTDLVPSVPLAAILDPVLADHGGPTPTHALVPGSPAIDAIPWGTNGCGTTLISDQRWQARPQPAGGACDIGAYEVEGAGQPLSGWVTGFTPQTVVCTNVTTGQQVTLSAPASPWDCEAAGLGVTSGDRVSQRGQGPVKTDGADVGGAVVGMVPSSGGCTNLTTGSR